MLAAALVPPTALLVPGVAGRATVLAAEREAALAAVGRLAAAGADTLVVIPPGSARATGRLRPTFAAAGIPDSAWSGPPVLSDNVLVDDVLVDDVAASVGLWLARAAGWSGEAEVSGADGPVELGPRSVALLVGGGSARRGPDAPLAEDPRAQAVDEALVAWLRAPGPSGLPSRELAEELAISAVGPLRVLAGGPPMRCTGLRVSVPLGATYLVATWEPR